MEPVTPDQRPPEEAWLVVVHVVDLTDYVVGRHGSRVGEGLRRLLEGSVSRRLVEATTRPVLVVPHA